MRAPILIILVVVGLAGISSAQVSVSVAALQPSGVALVDGTGQLQSQAIPVGQPWTAQTTYNVTTNGTGSAYFIDYVETEITPPLNQGTLSQSMVAIESRAFAQNNTTVSSLFTTGTVAGQPGTQRFRVTLTSAQPQNVELRAWAQGQNFGNASISAAMSFGTVTQSWTWAPGAGFSSSNQMWPIQVLGTVDVDVEITGQVTPGPGGGLYYDGYDTRWSLTVVPINTGSITYWGTGCGPASLSHTGVPTTGSLFTMSIDNVPAGAAPYFIIGTRTDFVPFLNLTLPFDMTPLGAPGCTLYVGSPAPWWIVSPDPGSPNTLSVYLNPWIGGTWYIQGLVFDASANPLGMTLTQAATLVF